MITCAATPSFPRAETDASPTPSSREIVSTMSVEAIALREQGAPDLPPDRRGDARVGQIELGGAQGCLRDLNLGGSNIESGAGFVESSLAAAWRSSSSC
jgi:hypothetical protein